MNILEAMKSIGIQPVSATSRYGWFEAPGHTGRPEIFVSATYGQWWNVRAPRYSGDAHMLASYLSYLKDMPINKEVRLLDLADPPTPMPGRQNIHRTLATIEKVKPIQTDTAIKAVLKSEVPIDKTRRYCQDFTFANAGVSGHRVLGLYNMSGGLISFDFSGRPRNLITTDLAIIAGDGSMPGSCLLVVGLKVFLHLDEVSYDVVLLPSSNVIERAIPFLRHYDTIDCVCPTRVILRTLDENLPSAITRVSPIEPQRLWAHTLFE